MENPKLRKWPRVPEGQKLQFRKRILMFSVFLLLSVFIWLLNALSENYTSVIQFPLAYTEMPEDRVSVGKLPDHLDLNINARGYALLSYKVFRRKEPIQFNLNSFTMNRREQDEGEAFMLTRYVRDQVAQQLPSELQLLEIRPDTLFFRFAPRVSRMIPVRPDIRFKLDRQFTTVQGVGVSPESIMVSGPDVILDTLKQVRTVPLDLDLLSRNYSGRVQLQAVQDLEYEVGGVDCAIELERITEVQLNVPVSVLNLPDTLSLQTFPSRIRLVCTVGLSKYDLLENHPFRAEVDFAHADDHEAVLDVQVRNIPAYVLDHEYHPKTVEFLTSLR